MGRSGLVHRMMGGTPQAALLSGANRVLKDPPQKGVVQLDPVTGHPRWIEWRRLDDSLAFRHEFEFLSKVPGFAMPVALFIADCFDTDNKLATVKSFGTRMRGGLFGFLDRQVYRKLTPATISDSDVRALMTFIAARKAGDITKHHAYGQAVRCLAALPGMTAELPVNPYPYVTQSGPPVFKGNHLYAVLSAAAKDVMMRRDRHEAMGDRTHVLWQDPHAARVMTLLAELRSMMPKGPAGDGVLRAPLPHEVARISPNLVAECEAVGFDEVRQWWGPCHENIGSSIVLLSYFFRLNLSLVRDLRWGEFGTIGDETVINKSKARAKGKRQLPGYVNGREPFDADDLHRFLRSWMADVRAAAGQERSRVLLMWRAKFPAAGPYVSNLSSTNAPARALEHFEKRYQLAHFTAQMFRPTTIELVDQASEGSRVLAPAVGQHTGQVRRRSYTTPESVWRSLLRMGMAMPVRARDLRARVNAFATGRIGGNHVAATPGWNCANPYYRGFSTAPEGELCDAIGRCAVCRFGRPDLDCVRSYANVLALLEAAEAEKIKGREVEWIGTYWPIVRAIVNRWIPAFDKEVRGTPAAELPHVPSLKGALRWPTF